MTPKEIAIMKACVKKYKHQSLGEFLWLIRTELGWSRRKVCEWTSRTPQSLLITEKELSIPRVDMLISLAKVYNLNLRVLTDKAIELYIRKRKEKAQKCVLSAYKIKEDSKPVKAKLKPKCQNFKKKALSFEEILEKHKKIAPPGMLPEKWGQLCVI